MSSSWQPAQCRGRSLRTGRFWKTPPIPIVSALPEALPGTPETGPEGAQGNRKMRCLPGTRGKGRSGSRKSRTGRFARRCMYRNFIRRTGTLPSPAEGRWADSGGSIGRQQRPANDKNGFGPRLQRRLFCWPWESSCWFRRTRIRLRRQARRCRRWQPRRRRRQPPRRRRRRQIPRS